VAGPLAHAAVGLDADAVEVVEELAGGLAGAGEHGPHHHALRSTPGPGLQGRVVEASRQGPETWL